MAASGFSKRPDYRVDLLRRRNRVTASLDGAVLADTSETILVDEQDHGLVFYFPRKDVRLDLLAPSDQRSRCPFKGEATYWASPGDGEPVAWSYEDPHPEVALIAGYVAFYQDRVHVDVGVATPAVVGHDS